MTKYMFDTNLYNAVLDGKISRDALAGARIVTTHIQADELRATGRSDPTREANLRSVFEAVGPEQIKTKSAAWGVSRWGEVGWPKDDLLTRLSLRIKALEKKRGKKTKALNRARDALIADTAIKMGLTLVSMDPELRIAATEHGGRTLDLQEFIREVAG